MIYVISIYPVFGLKKSKLSVWMQTKHHLNEHIFKSCKHFWFLTYLDLLKMTVEHWGEKKRTNNLFCIYTLFAPQPDFYVLKSAGLHLQTLQKLVKFSHIPASRMRHVKLLL